MTGKLKKVSQRFFALLVASLIVFAGFPFSASASEVNSNTEEAFENIEYTKNDTKPSSTGTSSNIIYTFDEDTKTLTISGSGNMADYSSPWYNYRSSAETLIISDGIKSIAKDSFYNCTALKKVIIPASVKSINDDAFYNCTNLTSVHITDIEAWCNIRFSNYASNPLYYAGNLYLNNELVTDVVIPQSITNIKMFTFIGCTSLTSVTIPDTVTEIDIAFSNCTNLTGVYITDMEAWCNIDFWGNKANPLYYAGNLYLNNELVTEVVIPQSITNIKSLLFIGCTSLTSVTIPDSVTSIGYYAFNNCENLANIKIPDGITGVYNSAFSNTAYFNNEANWEFGSLYLGRCLLSVNPEFTGTFPIKDGTICIGDSAFKDCLNITDVSIPDSVKYINSSAFNGCSSLASIVIPESITVIEEYTFKACTGLTNVTLPNTLKTIGKYAFSSCETLPSIVIPNSVTEIGAGAFNACRKLTSVTLPDTLAKIEGYTFYGCKKLPSITIPETVTGIGSSAFYFCSSLTSITIPKGVTTIGSEAFKSCGSLTGVYITDFEAWCNIDFQPYEANPLCSAGNLYLNNKLVTDVVLPKGKTSIGAFTFEGCKSLTSVIIPEGVTTIGRNCFKYCSNLTSVTLPNSITEISYSVFGSCKSLKTITIPNSIKTIRDFAFSDCTGLTDVYRPCTIEKWDNLFNKNATIHPVHQWDKGIVSSNPTCTKDGEITYTCQDCKETKTETIVYDHKFSDEFTIDKQATCTKAGSKSRHCSECDAKTDFTVIEATGHTHTREITSPATCTSEGVITYTCHCGDSYTKTIEKHPYEKIIDKAVAPTCTETGLTEGTHCSVCGETVITQTIIEATGHTHTSEITTPATCTTEGVMTYTCHCGDSYTRAIQKHPYPKDFDNAVAPTCTETGLTEGMRCSVCKEILIAQTIIEATGHTYTSEITIPASCTKEGVITYTCHCGDSYTKTIQKHPYSKIIDDAVAPTCTETGLTEGTHCSVCGETIIAQTVVETTGHTHTSEITTPATCTSEGVITYTCHCSDSYAETIQKLPHKTVTTSKKATYFAKGYKNKVTCKDCGTVISKGTVVKKLKLKTPKVTVKAGNKKLSVKYTKVKGATGFEVKYKIGKKIVKKVFTSKKATTRYFNNLKKGTYKVQVRAFVRKGNKKAYSNWTTAKKVTVK